MRRYNILEIEDYTPVSKGKRREAVFYYFLDITVWDDAQKLITIMTLTLGIISTSLFPIFKISYIYVIKE